MRTSVVAIAMILGSASSAEARTASIPPEMNYPTTFYKKSEWNELMEAAESYREQGRRFRFRYHREKSDDESSYTEGWIAWEG